MQQAIVLLGRGKHIPSLVRLLKTRLPDVDIIHATYRAIKTVHDHTSVCHLEKGKEIQQIKALLKTRQMLGVLNQSESYIVLQTQIVDAFKVPGPSYQAGKQCKDKAALHALMVANQLETYRPISQIVSLHLLGSVLSNCHMPVVVKPHIGAKSRGVFIIRDRKDVAHAAIYLKGYFSSSAVKTSGADNVVLIEEYIEGTQISSTCYADQDGKLNTLSYVSVVTGKDIGHQHNQLVHRTTPTKIPRNIAKRIEHILQKVLQIVGLKSTLLHPEFIIRDGVPYLIELNVRVGGFRTSMMQKAFGIDLESIEVDLALGKNPSYHRRYSKSCTATSVWSDRSGYITKLAIPSTASMSDVSIFGKIGNYYLAPPSSSKALAQYFTTTNNDSLTTAQAILDDIQIEIT